MTLHAFRDFQRLKPKQDQLLSNFACFGFNCKLRHYSTGGGGVGSSCAPLRVGAASTSYGWALGAADLLVPGAARFDMRAVSAVTAFVVPPDMVQQILAGAGASAALWRAAFGLLAATLLRDDLGTVPPQSVRAAATKSRVTRWGPCCFTPA